MRSLENEIHHPADIYARKGKIDSEVNSYYSIPGDIPPNPFDEAIMQFGEPDLEGRRPNFIYIDNRYFTLEKRFI